MLSDIHLQALESVLCPPPMPGQPVSSLYVVLDGASVPSILDELEAHGLPHLCLYWGRLSPLLSVKAPYLVALKPHSTGLRWILRHGWGEHWGVFFTAPPAVSMERLQRHLRQFVQVQDEAGNFLYFRFYDPRVLSVYLPTCTAAELNAVYGPITSFTCEREEDGWALEHRLEAGKSRVEAKTLAPNAR